MAVGFLASHFTSCGRSKRDAWSPTRD